MVINQWVPAAHRGDAIGDSARRVRDILRRQGHASRIFALTVDDDMRDQVGAFGDPAARTGDVTILHFALPSPMTEAFAALPRGRVLQYHNITPAKFWADFHPGNFRLAVLGRRELASLAARTDLAMGDSEYNCRELADLGFREPVVFPIAVNVDRITNAARVPALDHWLDDGLTNFLFVGRVAPNKRIEDIIRLAEHYKRYVDAYYRFIVVGRTDGVPRYYDMLRAFISELGWLQDRFVFTGLVPDDELAAYYRASSVYLSMSDHEGFCVPLVEAMAADVPIMAYASSAVPDTLGGAGVQFTVKDFEQCAELLGILAFDDGLRSDVIAGQRARLGYFLGDRLEVACRELVERFQ